MKVRSKRKAPAMTVDELESRLEHYDEEDASSHPLDRLFERIQCHRGETMKALGVRYSEEIPFQEDPEHAGVSGTGEPLIGYHALENGFSFLGLAGCGPRNAMSPMFFIVYHDGRRTRSYVPMDGNMVNPDTGCFLGSTGAVEPARNQDDAFFAKLTEKYIKKGLLPEGTPAIAAKDRHIFDDLRYMEIGAVPKADLSALVGDEAAYRAWYRTAFPKDGTVLLDWDAIRQDILDHIEAVEPEIIETYYSVSIDVSYPHIVSGIAADSMQGFLAELLREHPGYAERPFSVDRADTLGKKDKDGRNVTVWTDVYEGHLTPAGIRLLLSRLRRGPVPA